ncbi:MAG TPA: hypothetical protein VF747_03215, partial [Blastocatellia bacterium]
AFFAIAFISEVVTTWLQQFRADRLLGSGIFYSDLGTLFLNRLLYWLALYLLLSVLWLLISRSYESS